MALALVFSPAAADGGYGGYARYNARYNGCYDAGYDGDRALVPATRGLARGEQHLDRPSWPEPLHQDRTTIPLHTFVRR